MKSDQGRCPGTGRWMSGSANEGGFALVTTLVIVTIIGIVAMSNLRTTELTEVLAGNSIQRSRALQAAEGGLIEAERNASAMLQRRVFASVIARDGIFTRDSVHERWWRTAGYEGSQAVANSAYPGVISPPIYIVEQIGLYESDGGSGIVSLDRGGAGYGRRTANGRQMVLYKIQSKGVGSTNNAQAVVESLSVQSQ